MVLQVWSLRLVLLLVAGSTSRTPTAGSSGTAGIVSEISISGWIHKQDPYSWFQWYCRYGLWDQYRWLDPQAGPLRLVPVVLQVWSLRLVLLLVAGSTSRTPTASASGTAGIVSEISIGSWIHKQDPYSWFQWYCRYGLWDQYRWLDPQAGPPTAGSSGTAGIVSEISISGWIHRQDPYSWFQWYCRYSLWDQYRWLDPQAGPLQLVPVVLQVWSLIITHQTMCQWKFCFRQSRGSADYLQHLCILILPVVRKRWNEWRKKHVAIWVILAAAP